MRFEEEIDVIDKKIAELNNFSKEKDINLSSEIEKLKKSKTKKLKIIYSNLTPWDKVAVSRHPKRPYTLDYIKHISTDFIELHGDRLYKDDPAIVGGLCKIDGKKVMIVGHQKGRTTEEKIYRNFGMANPEGYRKALRLFKLAEKFSVPILTFIDTPGAYPGIEAEKHGQGEAIARNLMEMSGIKVPIISVVIGEGGSGGALGLSVADRIFMLENSIYSVISPEGCAAILFKDSTKAEQAAENLKITSQDLFEIGVIDGIIEEAVGGAHRGHKITANNLKNVVTTAFFDLEHMEVDSLLNERYQKYRDIGSFKPNI